MSSLKPIFTVNPGTNFTAINGFPDLNTLPTWSIEINFTVAVTKSWSGLLGNMRNTKLTNFNNANTKPNGPYITDKDRGWGLWIGGIVNDSKTIHWSGASDSSDLLNLEKIQPDISYKLVITKSNNTTLLFTLTNTKTNVVTTQTITFIPIVTVGDTWVGNWEYHKTEVFNGSVASIVVSGSGPVADRCDWRSNTTCIFRDYNGNNESGCVAPDPVFNYLGLNSYDTTGLGNWLTTLYNRDGGNATVKAALKSEKYNVYDYYNRCKDYAGYEFLKALNFSNPLLYCNETLKPNTECMIMEGSFFTNKGLVDNISITNTGDKVYIKFDSPFTKMVTAKGEARYYEGPVSNYKPCNWTTYSPQTTAGAYVIRKATGTECPTYCNETLKPNTECMIMEGSAMGSKGLVDNISVTNTGEKVYIKFDSPYTKMVTANGEAKYYEGPISNYKPCNWSTYTLQTLKGAYVIRVGTGSECPAIIAPAVVPAVVTTLPAVVSLPVSSYSLSSVGMWAGEVANEYTCVNEPTRNSTGSNGDYNRYCIFNNENDAKKYCDSDLTCKGYIANSANNMFTVTKKPVTNTSANGSFFIKNTVSTPSATRTWNVQWRASGDKSFILFLGPIFNSQSKQAFHFNIRTNTTIINTYDGSTWYSPHVEINTLHQAARPIDLKVTFNTTNGFTLEYKNQIIATIPNRFNILNANDLNIQVTDSIGIIVTESTPAPAPAPAMTFNKLDKTNCVYARISTPGQSGSNFKYLGDFDTFEQCAVSPNIDINVKAITHHGINSGGFSRQCYSINDNNTQISNQSDTTCGILRTSAPVPAPAPAPISLNNIDIGGVTMRPAPAPAPTVVLTLGGTISTFGEGSERRNTFITDLATTLGIKKSQIVIKSMKEGSVILEIEFLQDANSSVSPAQAIAQLKDASVSGKLKTLGVETLNIGATGPVSGPVASPFVQSTVSQLTTPVAGTNTYASDYLNLVGNLKLRGSSMVDGNLIVNNNGTQVAGISNTGDLMLKGGIVFGDSASNAWRLSADGNNFLIQKSGEQGLSVTSKGVVTPSPTLNINAWTFPKF